jgi:hypothetical protein
MKAQTITLTLTVRPSYSDVDEGFKQEIEESLYWLTQDHNACRIEWGAIGEGEWPDEEEDDE